jgi:hypothetical protein
MNLVQVGPAQRIQSLFVVDTGAPWIRSFLHSMPHTVRIHGFRVHNAISFPGGLHGLVRKGGRREVVSESWDDLYVPIPSWHRAFGLSSSLVTIQVKNSIRCFGSPDAILFTLPWYARVAEALPGVVKAYYAYDPYRFFDWGSERIIDLETALLGSCNVGFGVARRLVEDLRRMGSTPVDYLPNATLWRPGGANGEGELAADDTLKSVPRPRVACVGQINSTAYDWALIEDMSITFPNAHFVFVGPRAPEKRAAINIDAVFSRPNVHWIGSKPHSHLPAYLRQCDVLINPLLVNDHNDRRSLLRLYDYLTTDRPIVSTAIAEAFNHVPFVSIATDTDEFRRLLGEALDLRCAPDLERRWKYIAANTWSRRAAEFLGRVGAEIGKPSA